MRGERFQDTGTYLDQFMDSIDVHCPQCQRHAVVSAEGFPGWQQSVRLVCTHCGYNRQETVNGWRIAEAVDSFFGLPLWFVGSVRSHTLWAYNRRHLAFLQQVVGAELREKEPNRNTLLANRLPKWMLAKKNRAPVLKAIEKLAQK